MGLMSHCRFEGRFDHIRNPLPAGTCTSFTLYSRSEERLNKAEENDLDKSTFPSTSEEKVTMKNVELIDQTICSK